MSLIFRLVPERRLVLDPLTTSVRDAWFVDLLRGFLEEGDVPASRADDGELLSATCAVAISVRLQSTLLHRLACDPEGLGVGAASADFVRPGELSI